MSDRSKVLIDTESVEVVTYLARRLELPAGDIYKLMTALRDIAQHSSVDGISFVDDELLTGTVMISEPETLSAEEIHRQVAEMLGGENVREALLAHLTGISVQELRELGGLPAQEKPFKTGFNA